MQSYLDILREAMDHGELKKNRTGTPALSLFNVGLDISIRHSFPLLTTKKIHFKSVAYELLWFLRGETNIKWLNDNGVTIWDEWADDNGDLGPIYGHQWRSWPADPAPIDQISKVVEGLREDPYSRRHIVSAWNVADIDLMALPPCHAFFQFVVHEETLCCILSQRSADIFLGLPFNIASYALLTYMISKVTGLMPGRLAINIGDAHLYVNHIQQAEEQLKREPLQLPRLEIVGKHESIDTIDYESIRLIDYKSHPKIEAPVAV